MAALKFRNSNANDTQALYRLWGRSVGATHHFLKPHDLASICVAVQTQYLPTAALIVAERDGVIVGFMGMTGRKIDALFLDPCVFGQGIGRAFIDHARACGKGPLQVDVNESNTGARAFYERVGFVVIDRSPTDDDGRPYPLLHLAERAPHAVNP